MILGARFKTGDKVMVEKRTRYVTDTRMSHILFAASGVVQEGPHRSPYGIWYKVKIVRVFIECPHEAIHVHDNIGAMEEDLRPDTSWPTT